MNVGLEGNFLFDMIDAVAETTIFIVSKMFFEYQHLFPDTE